MAILIDIIWLGTSPGSIEINFSKLIVRFFFTCNKKSCCCCCKKMATASLKHHINSDCRKLLKLFILCIMLRVAVNRLMRSFFSSFFLFFRQIVSHVRILLKTDATAHQQTQCHALT